MRQAWVLRQTKSFHEPVKAGKPLRERKFSTPPQAVFVLRITVRGFLFFMPNPELKMEAKSNGITGQRLCNNL
jgi:hypothetical protein